MADTLYIVIPCYNEEEVLPDTSKQMKEKIKSLVSAGKINERSRVMFVDDGSKDKTWEIISSLCKEDKVFSGVKLSRNKGHQNALMAGLLTAKPLSDMTISIDADLQDDINAIDKMVDDYNNGSDVVYGVRSSRKKDTFFKRFTAEGFYKFMKALGVDIVFNHADFRLMSKRALDGMEEFTEVNLFLRGIVPLIGYKSSVVEYERGERMAGESKYPLKKMLAFAFDGITSFSVKPIKIITNFGGVLAFLSFVGLLLSIILKFTVGFNYDWIMLSTICLFSGIQLLSVGIIGQYVGKIYFETKRRPRFIIEAVLDRE